MADRLRDGPRRIQSAGDTCGILSNMKSKVRHRFDVFIVSGKKGESNRVINSSQFSEDNLDPTWVKQGITTSERIPL